MIINSHVIAMRSAHAHFPLLMAIISQVQPSLDLYKAVVDSNTKDDFIIHDREILPSNC